MRRGCHKCLIVDDSRADARVLALFLEAARPGRIEIESVESRAQALDRIARGGLDSVFIDYRLEDESGLDLLRELRALGSDVPVVFISGCGNEEVAAEAMCSGAQDYLVKDLLAPSRLDLTLKRVVSVVELERAVERSRMELASFAQHAAHDLRAPLRSIRHLCEILGEELERGATAENREILQQMERTAGRMDGLVRGLLEFSLATDGHDEHTRVDLNEVLQVVLENLRAAIESSGTDVSLGPLPVVQGCRESLERLFQNLVGNAIQHRNVDSAGLRVEVATSEDGTEVRVRDDGPGFDPAYVDRVLEPLFRLRGVEGEGAGLGLTICAKIAERHEATFRLETQPGAGTTVWLGFPPDRVDASSLASSLSAPSSL